MTQKGLAVTLCERVFEVGGQMFGRYLTVLPRALDSHASITYLVLIRT